ncbi:ribosomal RNA small subunit methyltransferase A [Candidatus Dojkabacteria bacterium]|mgnify:CR=1 FL=1|nr:ribosomal RNA small subunit methyltransferase A [Candidatus Dojkabacteria bacterium]
MHNFKKQFGQNFLKNTKYAKTLVSELKLTPEDTIVEIGPGDGAVTKFLLETGCKVISFEVDYDLVPKLLKQFEKYSNFVLVHQDILQVDLPEVLAQHNATQSIKVTGALPYNISKKIIDLCLRFNLENDKYNIKICTFIVQEEVAKDYVAAVPKASFLSNYAKIFAKVRKLESIPKYMFYPEPKVNGGILRFEIHENISTNYAEINKLLRIGFSNPRKTLNNNLKSSKKFIEQNIQDSYANLSIKSTARPAELTFEEWVALTESLNNVDI